MSIDHDKLFNDFDPNGMKSDLWGLYEGGNSFRTFSKRGAALNAASRCFRFKLYQLKPEGWVLAAQQDTAAKDRCDDCGTHNVQESYRPHHGHGWGWEKKAWCWERVHGKISTPLRLFFLCAGCKNVRGY